MYIVINYKENSNKKFRDLLSAMRYADSLRNAESNIIWIAKLEAPEFELNPIAKIIDGEVVPLAKNEYIRSI